MPKTLLVTNDFPPVIGGTESYLRDFVSLLDPNEIIVFAPTRDQAACQSYDAQLDYADLLVDSESWGDEPPVELADELTRRVRVRMTQVMAEIRGERAPSGYWDYRTMSRVTD